MTGSSRLMVSLGNCVYLDNLFLHRKRRVFRGVLCRQHCPSEGKCSKVKAKLILLISLTYWSNWPTDLTLVRSGHCWRHCSESIPFLSGRPEAGSSAQMPESGFWKKRGWWGRGVAVRTWGNVSANRTVGMLTRPITCLETKVDENRWKEDYYVGKKRFQASN